MVLNGKKGLVIRVNEHLGKFYKANSALQYMVKSIIIKDEPHWRAKRIAEAQGKTIGRITEEAIGEYADKIEYTAEAFIRFVFKNKNLAIYSEYLKEEFAGAPFTVYRDIIKFDEECAGEIDFHVLNSPFSKEKFKDIFNQNTEGGFIIFKTNEENIEKARKRVEEVGKMIEELSDKEVEGDKIKEINIKIILKRDRNLTEGKDELLVFSCHKKKEIADDKKEKLGKTNKEEKKW